MATQSPKTAKPTPRPWKFDTGEPMDNFYITGNVKSKGIIARNLVAIATSPANAELIVKAVNAHNDMLEALKRIAKQDCEYPGSAGCNLLPEGVYRSVCNPCHAKAIITKTTQ